MDLGMQCLDPAIHHFGKAGVGGDVADVEAGLLQVLPRAAGGDKSRRRAPTSPRAKSTRPSLSLTLIKARLMGTMSMELVS